MTFGNKFKSGLSDDLIVSKENFKKIMIWKNFKILPLLYFDNFKAISKKQDIIEREHCLCNNGILQNITIPNHGFLQYYTFTANFEKKKFLYKFV